MFKESMGIKKTTEQFIEEAKAIHGDKYDYSLVEYTRNNKDVTIICKIHGETKQRPSNHLSSCGCYFCAKEKLTENKTRSREEFIKACQNTHGDLYDYTLTEYKNCKDSIKIICKKHGVFVATADNHQRRQGCSQCKKEESIKKQELNFTEKANSIYNNKYDYSNIKYVNTITEVGIVCPKHGVFSQKPANHLLGKECTECEKEKKINEKSKTINFIKKAKEKHGDEYDYNLTNYINAKTKVKIVCKNHGEFEQNPISHKRGAGCLKCSNIKKGESIRSNTESFIKKAELLHNSRYDYSLVNYTHSRTKVTIICKEHGMFEQSPTTHLKSSGCQRCASLINIYKKEDYIKLAEKAILYLVLIESENEKFYKIGKTKNTVMQRLSNNISIYNFKIISEYTDYSGTIFDLENDLHNKYFNYKYKPNNLFSGHTECYNIDLPIDEIINIKNTY